MTKESTLQRQIMLACSERGYTVWRNNVGKGWVAPPPRTMRATKQMTVTLMPGDVVLRDPYWLTWGLCKGSTDLIGIKPVVVTQKMVGLTIGQFFAPEVKTPTGRVSNEQKNFIQHANDQGGCALVVRGVGDIS